MLQKYRIGTRLAVGFSGMIAVAIAAFTASALLGRHSEVALEAAALASQQRSDAVHAIQDEQLRLVSTIRNAGLQTDGAMVNAEADAYRQSLKRLQKREAAFAQMPPLSADERSLLDQAVALRRESEPLADQAMMLAMAYAGDEAAKVLTGKFSTLQTRWAAQLDRLSGLQHDRMLASASEITTAAALKGKVLACMLLAMTLASAWFAVALTRSVTRPLRQAAALAARVADGDLTARIEVQGKDEAADLLRSLQTMTRQLATMVRAVHESSDSITHASAEISSGNIDLSTRTERTAASLQETAATLTGLTATVVRSAGNADSVRELADRTAQIAEQGGASMRAVAGTMQGIDESSRRIAEIVGVIDGIAFQTNILALNAAVEAARAGEQGRGFAVVASEVRALAGRAASAAGEVRGLIGESVGRVAGGTRLVSAMGGTMAELVDGVTRMRALIGDISAASSSQTQSIQQVNGAVRDIDGSTQQNSALVEQVAAAARGLSVQTRLLTGLVHRFRVGA